MAALVPGILTYRIPAGKVYLAVAEGILVKSGDQVLVSVRRAIAGSDLSTLHDSVTRDFLSVDAEQRVVRHAVASMESAFFARFDRLDHA